MHFLGVLCRYKANLRLRVVAWYLSLKRAVGGEKAAARYRVNGLMRATEKPYGLVVVDGLYPLKYSAYIEYAAERMILSSIRVVPQDVCLQSCPYQGMRLFFSFL